MQGSQSQQNVPEMLRNGEKHLQKGAIGKAKKCVVRAAYALSDHGIQPEECPRLLGLAKSILLAETLQRELDKNPAQTKDFLRKCALILKDKMESVREQTMRNLQKS